MNIVAIVQARMGSTRLPGKVMEKILGKTIIQWDIERISLSEYIDKVVLAIPFGKENDVIEEVVKKNTDAFVFRGDEDDVLDRYYQAATSYNADAIVRITSDCPLIDPNIVDKTINHYLNNECDYCSNTLERTYPRGLDTEIFSYNSLKKAWENAKNDYEREHVTPYLYQNKDLFKLCSFVNDTDYSHLRWTLDTTEDLELITAIYQELSQDGKHFFTSEILSLFQEKNDLVNINKNVCQKSF